MNREKTPAAGTPAKPDNRAVLAVIAAGLALSIFAVVLPFHGALGWLP